MARPVDYKPEYCQMLIEHRRQGLSFESFAATVGCCRKTLYNWEKQFPEFLHAKNAARDVSLKTFEQMGMALASGKLKGNPAAWIFMLKNQHPDKYSESPTPGGDAIDELVFGE